MGLEENNELQQIENKSIQPQGEYDSFFENYIISSIDKNILEKTTSSLPQSIRSSESIQQFISLFQSDRKPKDGIGIKLNIIIDVFGNQIATNKGFESSFQQNPKLFVQNFKGKVKSLESYKNSAQIESSRQPIAKNFPKIDTTIKIPIDTSKIDKSKLSQATLESGIIRISDIIKLIVNTVTGISEEAVLSLIAQNYSIYLKQQSGEQLSSDEQKSYEQFSTTLSTMGIDPSSFFSNLAPSTITSPSSREISNTSQTPSLATLDSPRVLTSIPNLPSSTEINSLPSTLDHSFSPETLQSLISTIIPYNIMPKRNNLPGTAPNYPETVQELQTFCDQSDKIPFLTNILPHANDEQIQGLATALFFVACEKKAPYANYTDIMKSCNIDTTKPSAPDMIKHRSESFVSAIKQKTISPLDTALTQDLSQVYLSHVHDFINQTPGLEHCIIDPEHIQITMNGFVLPYTIDGMPYTLRMQDGKLTAESFFDEGNIASNVNIFKGIEAIGSFPTMADIHAKVTKNITPDTITSLLHSDDISASRDKIVVQAKEQGRKSDQKFAYQSASLSHNIAGMQGREASKSLLLHWDQTNPESRIDNHLDHNGSPFANVFLSYQKNETINQSNQPVGYPLLHTIRNSLLGRSADELGQYTTLINKLNNLRADPKLNTKLKEVSNNPLLIDESQPSRLALHLLNPDHANDDYKTLLLFDLISDHNAQGSQINLNRLSQLINQLDHFTNPTSTINDFQLPINLAFQSDRIKNYFDAEEKELADANLETARDDIA